MVLVVRALPMVARSRMPIRPDVIQKRVRVLEAQVGLYLDADDRGLVRAALIEPRRC
jgi:hypothetical protein